MNIGVVSLFPEMFRAISDYGVIGRAASQNIVNLEFVNPRDFAGDKHKTVDDKPFGGGPGMLMKVVPLEKAWAAVRDRLLLLSGSSDKASVKTIYVSPQGERFTQQKACELAGCENLVFIAGRYEGLDERLIESVVDEELSLGDYVLSGGELPVMVMIDTITRLLPEVLGNEDSTIKESFQSGLLEGAQYTRPREIEGYDTQVPPVLLSGDHEALRLWELKAGLIRTYQRRPDLLAARDLTSEERNLLSEYFSDNSDEADS